MRRFVKRFKLLLVEEIVTEFSGPDKHGALGDAGAELNSLRPLVLVLHKLDGTRSLTNRRDLGDEIQEQNQKINTRTHCSDLCFSPGQSNPSKNTIRRSK